MQSNSPARILFFPAVISFFPFIKLHKNGILVLEHLILHLRERFRGAEALKAFLLY